MPSISDLKVRLSFLADDRELRRFESRLRRSGERLAQLGDQVSLSLSAPLALFGAAAIKSAGDIESLRLALETTMQDAGRSTEDARMELEELRKAALAPGLDFEQAVQGSIRLQNVGFSAEKSREILVELANAIAMAGGSAEQLDGVTRQFGQMIAKGRVLQEDLSIIQENMPSITKAMNQAFGTASAERLREMGISAQEFVDGVTAQLKTLPRVSGGIKNSIVNAGSALRNFMATIGEEINNVFDLGAESDRLSAKLNELANWFKSLDDSTKRAIVQFGLAVVAAGPLIKVLGTLRLAGAQMVSVYRGVVSAVSALPAKFTAAKASFSALNTVVKASIIGLIIGGIAIAVQELQRSWDRANVAGRTATEVNKQAAEAVSSEKTKVMLLVDVLNDETSSREEKRKAIDALKRINPQYFGQLDEEAVKTGKLAKSVDAYVESALKAARVKAALLELEAVDRQLSNLAETAVENATVLDKVRGALAVVKDQYFGTNSAVELSMQNLAAEKAALLEKQNTLKGIISDNGSYVDAVNESTGATTNFSGSVSATNANLKDTKDELSEITERLLAMNEQAAKAQAGEMTRIAGTQSLGGGVGGGIDVASMLGATSSGALEQTTAQFQSLTQAVNGFTTAVGESATPTFDTFATLMSEGMYPIASAFETIGMSIASSLDQGAQSFRSFARSALQAIGQVISMLIKQAVASAIAGAFKSSGNPLVGAALASIGGALAASLFNRLVGGATAKFAKGGIVSGPTMGLIGEYSGARSNPEVIAPLDRLQSMLEVGGVGGTLTTRVSGKDLLIVLEGAQKDARRARGF